MQEFYTIEAVEKYLNGEMTVEEKKQFDLLRQTNADLDQLVVAHGSFLVQMQQVANRQQLQNSLNEIHQKLVAEGDIKTSSLKNQAKLIALWHKYKKTAAVAACIAGITTFTISSLVLSNASNAPSTADLEQLTREIRATKNKTDKLENDLASVKNEENTDASLVYKTVGTGFFINQSGLMITNAHVVKSSKNISVFNTKGDLFSATIVKLDLNRDVAIIKINDRRFKPFSTLPYGISKKSSALASPVFTLGYPRDEIVYGEGYISAKTGFNGDTLSCQVSIPANPGNSGGPVFNKHGEVIGILSAKQKQAEGAAFAVQSKYIYKAIEELKTDAAYKNTKLNSKSSVNGWPLEQQVLKIQDYVWMVKGD